MHADRPVRKQTQSPGRSLCGFLSVDIRSHMHIYICMNTSIHGCSYSHIPMSNNLVPITITSEAQPDPKLVSSAGFPAPRPQDRHGSRPQARCSTSWADAGTCESLCIGRGNSGGTYWSASSGSLLKSCFAATMACRMPCFQASRAGEYLFVFRYLLCGLCCTIRRGLDCRGCVGVLFEGVVYAFVYICISMYRQGHPSG
jgi:hypothetical protein